MHYTLVFSTSNAITKTHSASRWLDIFAESFAFLHPQNDAKWLAPGLAAEMTCVLSAEKDYSEIIKSSQFLTLRQHTEDALIDVNLVPTQNRRKMLLIADMDSTIIKSESLDELSYLAGVGEQNVAITHRAMAGEIDFETALEERVAKLAGTPIELIDKVLEKNNLTCGATTLVNTMRKNGAFCYLISGGFDVLTEPVAKKCGFHNYHANHLLEECGYIIGTVQKPILDHFAKVNYLNHYCSLHNISPDNTAAIGDGANDIKMLNAAGFGVAFNGKPILRQEIPLQLNHTDLTGLLFLQGFRQDQFIIGI